MKQLRRFKERLSQDLQNEDFKKAFEEENLFADLAIKIANVRQEKGISQKELAKRLHTSQQMVSRLEHPKNMSFSLKTLVKIARVLNKHLSIELI